jgi:hypothetical protein
VSRASTLAASPARPASWGRHGRHSLCLAGSWRISARSCACCYSVRLSAGAVGRGAKANVNSDDFKVRYYEWRTIGRSIGGTGSASWPR